MQSLQVEPWEQPCYVWVALFSGTPAEQATIINAALRAYVRYFEEEQAQEINGLLEADKSRIFNEVYNRMLLQPAELRKTREGYIRLWNELMGDQLDRSKAARTKEIRAASGKLPAVIQWAQEP